VAEHLLSIPVSLLLRADVGLSDSAYGAAFRALRAEVGADLDDRLLLVLVVLVERLKGHESRWATYISYLPTEYGAASVRFQGPHPSAAHCSSTLLTHTSFT
jgi:hypothetical protein